MMYSMRGYADFWAGTAERMRDAGLRNNISNSPFLFSGVDEMAVYNLGVNVVVYALTREGSLARQLVAAD